MNNLTVTEFKDIRVLTTQQLAEKYQTVPELLTKNFNRNKERYTEGKHYIALEGEEKNDFIDRGQFDRGLKNAKTLYLWTEKGCLLHAKSLGTDKAWEVYEELVDTYFQIKKPMSPLELMELQIKAIKEVDTKVNTVNNDLQAFKKDMPLLALECQKITRAKNQKVVPLMGGKQAPAYKDKSLMNRVYRDLEQQLKREFGVDTYKAIKRNQCNMAIQIINEYQLPHALKEEITDVNAQMGF